MTDTKLYGSFIAEKLSKVRFIQEKYKLADSFVSGSWGLSANAVNLWQLIKDEFSVGDDDSGFVPKSIAKVAVDGDVTGLEFLNADTIVCSTSSANAQLLFIHLNNQVSQNNLTVKSHVDKLHKYQSNDVPAVCTGLSVHDLNIATVGEDGSVNILSSHGRPIKTFKNVDSCAITCVSFVNHNEILAGNRIGNVNVFDARSNENKASYSLTVSSEDEKKSNCVTCIAYHPDQKHIVLCGSEEGSLTVWDLRHSAFPASYLRPHDNCAITDVAYHRTDPTKLFTTSEAGELYQWSYKANLLSDEQLKRAEGDNINPWLCGDRTKNKITWKPLLKDLGKSVNTFDASGSRIICGCDNEAVYLIDNI